MNKSLALIAFLVAAKTAYALEAPKAGDSRETVLASLGTPSGTMKVGAREELFFPRGKVVLEQGAVTVVELISPAEYAAKEKMRIAEASARAESLARESAERAELARKAAAELAVLRQNGEAALNKLLLSPVWKELSDEGKADALADFSKAYPATDIAALLNDYRRKAEKVRAGEKRLNDLETRLASAEKRATEAESRARLAEQRAASAETATRNAATLTVAEPRPQNTPQVIVVHTENCDHPHDPVWVIPNSGLNTRGRTAVTTSETKVSPPSR